MTLSEENTGGSLDRLGVENTVLRQDTKAPAAETKRYTIQLDRPRRKVRPHWRYL